MHRAGQGMSAGGAGLQEGAIILKARKGFELPTPTPLSHEVS